MKRKFNEEYVTKSHQTHTFQDLVKWFISRSIRDD